MKFFLLSSLLAASGSIRAMELPSWGIPDTSKVLGVGITISKNKVGNYAGIIYAENRTTLHTHTTVTKVVKKLATGEIQASAYPEACSACGYSWSTLKLTPSPTIVDRLKGEITDLEKRLTNL